MNTTGKVIITITALAGLGTGAYFLLKKPQIEVIEIVEKKKSGAVVQKTYHIKVGKREIQILVARGMEDTTVVTFPMYVYTFTTTTKILDNNGLPVVQVAIYNKLTKKTEENLGVN